MDTQQQTKGSADPPAKLSGADSDEGQSSPAVDKVSDEQGNDEGQSSPAVDKVSDEQGNDGSQDNSANSDKSADVRLSPSVTTETPTGETTGRSIVDVASGGGGADSDEGLSLPAVDKVSDQQGNDGSQDNSANSEKSNGHRQRVAAVKSEVVGHPPVIKQSDDKRQGYSKGDTSENDEPVDTTPDECYNQTTRSKNMDSSQKREGSANSTSKLSATPTSEATGRSIVDIAPGDGGADSDEGQSSPAVDKVSGQQGNDGSQDNSANLKSEVDGHPPVIGYQADDKRQDLLRTSKESQKEHPNEEPEKQRTSKKEDVELIGPTATQTELAEETGILGGGRKLLVAVFVVALVAMVAQYCLQSNSPPEKTDWQQVDVFLKQMKEVKARFPSQRAELWSRSEIHLKRHLQTSQPAEPVSLILTSGARAERTMRCLARDVASAFSTARKASFIHIEGAGKAGQDSDQVKLDIDRRLQGAFEGDKPVAVIHRLEELPPGSTLIFYRYCDHENAAYKKTFLIFTVLLGDEEEIPAETRLSIVEEMVDDYLQKRFLSPGHPVSFDKMDLNKYGGLWSRISHLILPVAAEDRIEQEGCSEDSTLF